MTKLIKQSHKNITISSNHLIRDSSLSWKARGIFMYLWSLPSNWKFHENEIATHSTDGINALNTGVKELEKHGYLKVARKRNKFGQMKKSDWIMTDYPNLNNQNLGNSNLNNKKLLNTNSTKHLHKQNTYVTNLPRNKFEKDFQKVDKFVQKKWVADIPSNRKLFIDRLVTKYGYKSVIDAMTIAYNNAIGIMGMPKYTAAVLKNNQHKPKGKHRNSYDRPIIKQKLPKWARSDYKVKLHPTSKKLQEEVRKNLAALNHRGESR